MFNPKKHVTTSEDDELRRSIADVILIGLSDDPAFAEPKTFAKWQRDNRKVLIGLFGGTGSNNLARIVSWIRREALQLRREQPEILCALSEAYRDDTLDPDIREALVASGINNFTDLLRHALLDPTFARSLLRPAPPGGLAAIRKMYYP